MARVFRFYMDDIDKCILIYRLNELGLILLDKKRNELQSKELGFIFVPSVNGKISTDRYITFNDTVVEDDQKIIHNGSLVIKDRYYNTSTISHSDEVLTRTFLRVTSIIRDILIESELDITGKKILISRSFRDNKENGYKFI